MRGVLLLALVIAVTVLAPAPAGATTKRDTSRVATAWMVTANGAQEFSWTATANGGQPQCSDPHGERKVRSVNGNGSFSLPFSTPRPYRMATVQVVQRAYKKSSYRTLSYRPKGAPKIEDQVLLPVTVNIAGQFTDQVLACDAFDASTETAPTTGCGSQAAMLDLRFGFAITDGVTRNHAGLSGLLVKPAFIDSDGKSTCPTYTSIATSYFNVGRGTAACSDNTALSAPGGPPEAGLAKSFDDAKYYARLIAARPKAFTLTVNKPMDCTLTPSDSYLPAVPAGGSLYITGSLHYTWTFTPVKVTGAAARTKPL